MKRLALIALLLGATLAIAADEIVTPSTPQRAGSEPLDPAREARVMQLGKLLRCAVCQGLSIADSPSSIARAQLDRVRDLVAEGKTDDEIKAYFVARYGEWVLLKPTMTGSNLGIWLGPGVLLIVGFLIILAQVRGRKVNPTAPEVAATEAPAEDEYLKRVRAETD